MTSQVEIYNMALGNIGISETVASLEERSKAQQTCSRYWEIARDTALAQFPWRFATKFATLALIGTPPRGWAYQYQYPNDCLKALGLNDERLAYTDWCRDSWSNWADLGRLVDWRTAYGDEGQVLLANQEGAELAYVVRVTDTGRYPPLFVQALAWQLSMLIAMPMTAQTSVVQTAMSGYMQAWQIAAAADLNESKGEYLAMPNDYLTGRG